jgi:hypothetical protein
MTAPACSESRARVRVRSASLAEEMFSTRPVVPTTIVAIVGTIMIRPSLDQIGRSRRRPTGIRRRENLEPSVVGRSLTSPPSVTGPAQWAPATVRPDQAEPPRFHHVRSAKESPCKVRSRLWRVCLVERTVTVQAVCPALKAGESSQTSHCKVLKLDESTIMPSTQREEPANRLMPYPPYVGPIHRLGVDKMCALTTPRLPK